MKDTGMKQKPRAKKQQQQKRNAGEERVETGQWD